jgi:hypothetical protein
MALGNNSTGSIVSWHELLFYVSPVHLESTREQLKARLRSICVSLLTQYGWTITRLVQSRWDRLQRNSFSRPTRSQKKIAEKEKCVSRRIVRAWRRRWWVGLRARLKGNPGNPSCWSAAGQLERCQQHKELKMFAFQMLQIYL